MTKDQMISDLGIDDDDETCEFCYDNEPRPLAKLFIVQSIIDIIVANNVIVLIVPANNKND